MKHLTSRRARFLELAILLGALFLSEPFSTCAQQKTGAAHQRLALVGGQIYPAPFEKPISDGMILIENGKIAAVGKRGNVQLPPDAETIDCTGHSIVAGLWNSHVHFSEPKWQDAVSLPAQQLTEQLQQMVTGYGFTSVVDTGSLLPNTVALRKRIESGEVAGPRILTAGLPIYPENGVPYYVIDSVPPELVKLLAQPATPEEAERIVDENINQGADIIKVFVVSWVRRDGKKGTLPMKLPILQAAVTEAHGRGKLVFAHPSLIEGVELVLPGPRGRARPHD